MQIAAGRAIPATAPICSQRMQVNARFWHHARESMAVRYRSNGLNGIELLRTGHWPMTETGREPKFKLRHDPVFFYVCRLIANKDVAVKDLLAN